MRSVLWALAFVAVIAGGCVLSALLRNGLLWRAPPGPAARVYRYLSGGVAETVAGSPYPELTPRRYDGVPPEHLFGVIEQALTKMERVQVVERDPKQRIVRVVRSTPLLGLRNDLAIRVASDPNGRGAVLFLRSESRVGHADFGANIRNILDFYAVLDAELPPPKDAAYKTPPPSEPFLF